MRLKTHKTEVKSITYKHFTRSRRAVSLSEQNESALTDRAPHDNHVINWQASVVLDRESDRNGMCIKKAGYVQRESQQMNRDKGTHSATRTTNFLPRHNSTMARTGGGTE